MSANASNHPPRKAPDMLRRRPRLWVLGRATVRWDTTRHWQKRPCTRLRRRRCCNAQPMLDDSNYQVLGRKSSLEEMALAMALEMAQATALRSKCKETTDNLEVTHCSLRCTNRRLLVECPCTQALHWQRRAMRKARACAWPTSLTQAIFRMGVGASCWQFVDRDAISK